MSDTAPTRDQQAQKRLDAQLRLFSIRCAEVFERVLSGKLGMLDAVDMLHDASIASGLDDSVGTDAVQRVMSAAFASASASRDKSD